jgi:hypothetical protein
MESISKLYCFELIISCEERAGSLIKQIPLFEL